MKTRPIAATLWILASVALLAGCGGADDGDEIVEEDVDAIEEPICTGGEGCQGGCSMSQIRVAQRACRSAGSQLFGCWADAGGATYTYSCTNHPGVLL